MSKKGRYITIFVIIQIAVLTFNVIFILNLHQDNLQILTANIKDWQTRLYNKGFRVESEQALNSFNSKQDYLEFLRRFTVIVEQYASFHIYFAVELKFTKSTTTHVMGIKPIVWSNPNLLTDASIHRTMAQLHRTIDVWFFLSTKFLFREMVDLRTIPTEQLESVFQAVATAVRGGKTGPEFVSNVEGLQLVFSSSWYIMDDEERNQIGRNYIMACVSDTPENIEEGVTKQLNLYRR